MTVQMNPITEGTEANYWLSGMIIDENTMCKQVRNDCETLYISEPGKTCPMEILETLSKYNTEGRPIWKPMHAQPLYRLHGFVTHEGDGRAKTNAYVKDGTLGKDGIPLDIGMDVLYRGLCLLSDGAMTLEQQDAVIEIIKHCFD